MSCPYFREGTFGICVAPDAIHVPSIKEMENFCFRKWYSTCPNLTDNAYSEEAERITHYRSVTSAQNV